MAKKKTMEVTEQNVDILQYERKQLRASISAGRNKRNTKEKFDKLIEQTSKYQELTDILNTFGKKLEIQVEWLTPDYWKNIKAALTVRNAFETKRTKSIKSITPPEKQDKYIWRIILSWSTPPENCGCSTPVERVKDYMDRMSKIISIKLCETNSNTFVDRTEYTHIFELECDKMQYDSILESAKYILDISSATERDACNIGIYGKKLKK
jgi:hypothetical protein